MRKKYLNSQLGKKIGLQLQLILQPKSVRCSPFSFEICAKICFFGQKKGVCTFFHGTNTFLIQQLVLLKIKTWL
jgi:hypothetical protein